MLRLSESEYLEIERAAEFRSEFFDGEMFAMAGGTPQHSRIGTNLAREFDIQLESSQCVPYNADYESKSRQPAFLPTPTYRSSAVRSSLRREGTIQSLIQL